MTAAADIELRRDGLTLTARRFGPANGPPVLLLHGFPDTPHSFDGVAARLAAAGHDVIVPWLRGYTNGSLRRGAAYDVLAASQDLDAWRRELAVGPMHLVGHDWGAFAAMLSAKRQPEQWRSLSLLAVPPLGPLGQILAATRFYPRQAMRSSYIALTQAPFAAQALSARGAALVRHLWHVWSPGWAFGDEQFAPARKVFTDRPLARAAAAYYRLLRSPWSSRTRAFYAQAVMTAPAPLPTLALAGLRDGCMEIDVHRILSRRTRAVRLEGCGHFLHAERPDAVTAELLAHFNDLDLDPTTTDCHVRRENHDRHR